MALDITLYQDRLNAYKIGTKDNQIDLMKNQIINDFLTNPSYFSVDIDGTARDVHITDDEKVKVLCKPNEGINVGSIITWKTHKWICIETNNNDDVQVIGEIKKSNHILKWKNASNQTISYPAIVENFRSQTDGIHEDKFLIVGDNELFVTLSNNSDTSILTRDFRFIIDNIPYKISKPDSVTKPGLVILTLIEDPKRDTDDLVNGIADNTSTTSGGGDLW